MERAKILFDLNGFIRVSGVLSAEELRRANEAINSRSGLMKERKGNVLRNSKNDTPLSGDMGTGRLDLGGMLGWRSPDCDVFRDMLCHKGIVSYLNMILGEGYRLDHSPLIIAQEAGSEGFSLHGGPELPFLQYAVERDRIFTSLLGVAFQLTDHGSGDGGFCVVKGSHKVNFPLTEDMRTGVDVDFWKENVEQPETQAGDVIIFSEATIHGCMPWRNENKQRRIALYRFSPPGCAYARGYSEGWPASFTEGMRPEQMAVMQPPFKTSFNRFCLGDDGSLRDPSNRSEEKTQFDKDVFGTKYY